MRRPRTATEFNLQAIIRSCATMLEYTDEIDSDEVTREGVSMVAQNLTDMATLYVNDAMPKRVDRDLKLAE